MLVALCHTRIGRSRYARGEVIREEVPPDKLAWLLEAEAVREVPEEPVEPPEGKQEDNSTQHAGKPQEGADKAVPAETEAEEEAEEKEDGEAAEIDVMAGIVPPQASRTAKPAAKETKPAKGSRKKGDGAK